MPRSLVFLLPVPLGAQLRPVTSWKWGTRRLAFTTVVNPLSRKHPCRFTIATTMAASGSRFESERSIEERKEQKRVARAEVLRQAKADFEKEERRKELKRLRGEDTWMLADVNERVEQLSQEHSVKKKRKKEKHSKKVKKEKKKKSKKQKCERNESSDSSSSSEEEWVEAVPLQVTDTEKAWKVKKEKSDKTEDAQIVQRDEWMTFDFMSIKTVSSSSLKDEKQTAKKIEQEKAQVIEQSRLSERELNPYWKNGGTGLPPEDTALSSFTRESLIEDGGLSWLKKSYQRMKEQAEKQNRNFEDVVAERYGSMETFQSRLEEAKRAASKSDSYGRERWRKSRYSDKEQSGQESKKTMEKNVLDSTSKDICYEYSSGSYSKLNMKSDRISSKDKYREEERENRSIEPARNESYQLRKDYDSRKKQDFSLLGHFKHKFLRPSEDDELPFGSGNSEASFASALLGQDSLNHNFLKPDENTEQISLSWSHEKRGGEKQNSDKKLVKPTGSTDDIQEISKNTRGKSQEENTSTSPEKREFLQKTKTSFSGCNLEDEPIHLLSEDEMNKLGAKIIKAELMGKMDLAVQLKAQLEKARKLKELGIQESTRKSEMEGESMQEEQEVVLVRTDHSGRAWPVSSPGVPSEPKEGRRKKQMVTTHIDKERVRYFHDDDDLSLKDLVKNEKMGTAEDQNRVFMKMVSKLTEKTDKEYYSLDDMFVSKAAKKECFGGDEEKQKKKAILEHQKLAAQMEKCPYCFDSSQLPKHLIIAIGIKVYLCLPNCQSLTEGHCLIVPLQHHTAATVLDEDIWEEIQSFRKALVKMFEDKELDCIFLETNMSMNKRYHMVYECIPLPKEVGDMAPIYFKKAIMESDEEWSMNKKLIDLSSRDIRKSVPRGLPYFSVDFGLQGGFAHVIEDQQKFPHYFGKEIIGGMLDAEPRLWRKGIRENFDNQRKKVLQFAQWWKPYDFTKSK
ncbi:CWF19-like protein 2 [Gracilinanus agilis]|uniref:CWF19-like protein 2 n=1 Tax=Gracilinanus agilis TaxID=191870 RepID=UPI001CFCE1F1|nr:CWF19-like protein 2 [Gracilinanus agilis]